MHAQYERGAPSTTSSTHTTMCTQSLQFLHDFYCLSIRPFPSPPLPPTRSVHWGRLFYSMYASMYNVCSKILSPLLFSLHLNIVSQEQQQQPQPQYPLTYPPPPHVICIGFDILYRASDHDKLAASTSSNLPSSIIDRQGQTDRDRKTYAADTLHHVII